ncbi:hypothetical protein SELMODRAFT_448198 [Selaginella moellendorffii]|uniref:WAT1-related protein n=1 Tax=Selaginella moellendorffii TaxID=88036 RepID=D8T5H1_SELML|nr:hypothetical protein SELMODRAFT_448198 [Selaginella moellendorffii]
MAELPSYYQNAPDKSYLNAALAIVQLGSAGFTILLRTSRVGSLGRFVFPLYQNCIGFLILAPLAFFYERDQRPELRFSTACRLFILGSIGVVINQVTYVTSSSSVSSLVSPSIPAAIESITPLFTLILAGACWLEEIHLRRRDGKAKVLGILLSCLGAVVIALGKGPVLLRSLAVPTNNLLQVQVSSESWQLSSIALIGSICLGIYLILQVPILTRYPAPLSVAAFSCLFGVLELGILSAIFERDTSKWILEPGSQIYCVIYAGFIGTALAFGTYSWGVFRGGPVIVAVYQPLRMVFTCTLAAVLLHQPFHFGSLIGTVLVIFGTCSVLWGREEQRRMAMGSSLTEHLWSPAD